MVQKETYLSTKILLKITESTLELLCFFLPSRRFGLARSRGREEKLRSPLALSAPPRGVPHWHGLSFNRFHGRLRDLGIYQSHLKHWVYLYFYLNNYI